MRTRLLATTAALTMALAACSGGTGGTGDTGETTDTADDAAAGAVTFVGTESLAWEETSKSATLDEGGALEVTVECLGAVPHNVVFEGVSDDAIIAECSGDDSGTGTVEVEPGSYTYYCSIPGHREAGMEGELTVS